MAGLKQSSDLRLSRRAYSLHGLTGLRPRSLALSGFPIYVARNFILLATLASMLMMPFVAAKEPKPPAGRRDGSSIEKAVLVRGGINAERAWLIEHLGYAPRINYEHGTIVRERRIFSRWSFSTPDGKRRDVYFDTGDYVKHIRLPEFDPTR